MKHTCEGLLAISYAEKWTMIICYISSMITKKGIQLQRMCLEKDRGRMIKKIRITKRVHQHIYEYLYHKKACFELCKNGRL